MKISINNTNTFSWRSVWVKIIIVLMVCNLLSPAIFSNQALAGGATDFQRVADPFPDLQYDVRIAFGDFDNDGDIDALAQNGSSVGQGYVYVRRNADGTYTQVNQSGTSIPNTPFANVNFSGLGGVGGFYVAQMIPIDYDDDGDTDIINRSGSLTENSVVVGRNALLRNDNGLFKEVTDVFPDLTYDVRIEFADFDNDGDIDVFAQEGSKVGQGYMYIRRNGDGTYTTFNQSGTSIPNTPFATADLTGMNGLNFFAVDYDNDGDKDIINRSGSVKENNVVVGVNSVLRNDNGTFSNTSDPFVDTDYDLRMIFGDFDNDGDVDALQQQSNVMGKGYIYMQRESNGTYTRFDQSGTSIPNTPFANVDFTGLNGITWFSIDYDSDGDLDVLSRSNSVTGGANFVFESIGSPPTLTSATPADNAIDVAVDTNITLNLSKTVTAGAGNIYIRKYSDRSLVETIAANSAKVTVNGSSVTINPDTTLNNNTGYYVVFDLNAFLDSDSKGFGYLNEFVRVGFDNRNLLNFTTVDVQTAVTPTVTTTSPATTITATGATVGGNVTADGGATITERGVVYGTSANPEIGGTGVTKVANSATTTGTFTASLTGLTASTNYYYRAYATNAQGTSYGVDGTFTTSANPTVPLPAVIKVTGTADTWTNLGTKLTDGEQGSVDIKDRQFEIYYANSDLDDTPSDDIGLYVIPEADIAPTMFEGERATLLNKDLTAPSIGGGTEKSRSHLVVTTDDGSEFKFDGLNVMNIDAHEGDDAKIEIVGYKDSVSTGSVTLQVAGSPNYISKFTSTELTPSIFQNVDRVVIKMSVLSSFANFGLIHRFNAFSLAEPVTSSTYTVTYDGNGNDNGSVPTDSTAYKAQDTVTVEGNTGSLTKEGYTFNGWNTKADGTGTAYAADDTFNMGIANVTLYAQWKASSDVNNLSNLSLSNVTFTPLFDPEKTSYTAYVADTVRNITVTATSTDSDATIAYKLNNTDVTATMTLQPGDNTIDIIVTAQNGTTKTYTVKVIVVTKSTIEIGDQTIEAGATVEVPVKLTTATTDGEAFQFDFTYEDEKLTFDGVVAPTDTNKAVKLESEKQTDGTIRVVGSADTAFVTGDIAILTFTAASTLVKDDTTTVSLSNIELSNGSDLPVNATDDATLTVNVKVSAIATLTDLQLKDKDNTIIAFNETFAKDTVTYTAAKTTPGNDVTVQVTKENEKSEVTYKLNGVLAATADMTLQPGKNVIEVIVTAEDKKTVKTYNITVTMGLKGDADVDGDVDINDWQKTANFILNRETPSVQAKWNTDMDDNNKVNISDWVCIAKKIVETE